MLSNYLAEILGISTVVISLAFLVKEKYLKRLFTLMETGESFFLWGLISFVLGLAIVLAHNIWIQDWRLIITVLGWLFLIKGLFLLFASELMKKWAKKVENASFLPFVMVVMVFIGLVITYLGFTA